MHRYTGEFRVTDLDVIYHYYFTDSHYFDGHRHRAWEINALFDGRLQVTDEECVTVLERGDVLLCAPERFHRNWVRPGDRAELAVLQFYTDDWPPRGEPRRFRMSESAEGVLRALLAEYAQFTQRVGNARKSADWPDVLRKLCESFVALTVTDEALPRYGQDRASQIYAAAVEYMNAHLSQSVTVAELAQNGLVSPTALKHAFLQCVGKGPIHYFNELRLREARHLLCDGVSVQETANRLGFSSPSYFSQMFRRETGVSPRAYRAENDGRSANEKSRPN